MGDDNFSAPRNRNFEFAFNSRNFSDRVLRIEIVTGDGQCKRRRTEEEKVGDFNVINSDNAEVEVALEDGSLRGSDYLGLDCSPLTIREKSIFINSAILAAESPFFYKLFSNGMRESDQRHISLRINASEEDALMELLSFMYSGKLATTSPQLVLHVLLAADKFEVASCIKCCSELLRSIPMTTESALLYLALPSSVSMMSFVQQLIGTAKEFIANKYRDITKYQDELITFPLAGIEAVLSSDNIQASSEDVIYDFAVKWAEAHYPVIKARREIFQTRLVRLIRFPAMSSRKLNEVLDSPDLDHEFISRVILGPLCFKTNTPPDLMPAISNRCIVGRAYKLRPIKLVDFELPYPQCIVYLDLKKGDCTDLFPGWRIISQAFHFGGKLLLLVAECCKIDHQQSPSYSFGLFLWSHEKGSHTATAMPMPTVDYEFAARTQPAGDFVSRYKGCHDFPKGKMIGYANLFSTSWANFMADDSPYFINGVLHLRAELTIKPQQRPQLQPQLQE